MDFEDNNPFGVSDEEGRRQLANESQIITISQTIHHTTHGQSIIISEATKIREGSSRGHIAYTIRLATGTAVRRRYSEFESFRKLLRKLFPCIVVPSIPEKHSITAYAANPTHAKDDARVIEHRQRTLAVFLNRCIAIPQIHDSWALERFLDPNTSWREVLVSERVASLPKSALQAPPIDPASATPAHAFLPIPSGGAHLVSSLESKDDVDDDDNAPLSANDTNFREYERTIGNGLNKRARKINRHYSALAAEYADFGGQLNSFSLDSHGQFDKFAPAVEKVGQAVDQGYISTSNLVDRLSVEFSEPLSESVQLASTARQVLKYRHQRELQVQILQDSLVKQSEQLKKLQKAESEAERINSYLHADDRINAATSGLNYDRAESEDAPDGHNGIDQSVESDHFNESDRDGEVYHDVTKLDSRHDERTSKVDGNVDYKSDGRFDNRNDGRLDKPGNKDNSLDNKFDKFDKFDNKFDNNLDVKHDDGDIENLVPSSKSDTKNRRGFKLPGLSHLNHALHGMIDVDPQAARRNNITRLQERIQQNRAALEVAEVDAKVAAAAVEEEISRYNEAKREDIHSFVKAFVRCHIAWAEKNLESWIEAKQAIADS